MLDRPVYFLTWTTYGTWLPGDARGWIDRREAGCGMDIREPAPALEDWTRGQMTNAPARLSVKERAIASRAVEQVCQHRDWELIALNCRSNHVHALVRADGTRPEAVMNQFKAYATRALRRAGLTRRKVWTRGGSTRYINTQASLDTAVQYVTFQRNGEPPAP